MKKKITIIALLLITTLGFSQSKHERIKALKVAHLTEVLNLTSQEAEKFWPIHNAFEKEKHQFRKNKIINKTDLNIDDLTEDEALNLINKFESQLKKEFNLRKQYNKDLLKILPAKKIIKLHKAEREFRHKMFKEFKRRRGKNRR